MSRLRVFIETLSKIETLGQIFQPFCGRGTQNLDLLNVPKASDNWRNPRLFSRNLQLKNTDVDDVLDLTGSSDVLLVGGDF